jgi:hypothetical protein
VVESSGLLNRRTVKSCTESSNLSLSARIFKGLAIGAIQTKSASATRIADRHHLGFFVAAHGRAGNANYCFKKATTLPIADPTSRAKFEVAFVILILDSSSSALNQSTSGVPHGCPRSSQN